MVGTYNGYGNGSVPTPPASATVASGPQVTPVLYGVVQYDFAAEGTDELSVQGGESIIIIARSKGGWVECKLVCRLGGPGLIPISFIEIRDVTTGKQVRLGFIAESGYIVV